MVRVDAGLKKPLEELRRRTGARSIAETVEVVIQQAVDAAGLTPTSQVLPLEAPSHTPTYEATHED